MKVYILNVEALILPLLGLKNTGRKLISEERLEKSFLWNLRGVREKKIEADKSSLRKWLNQIT